MMEWNGAGDAMSPEVWGWKACDGSFLPVILPLSPALEALLLHRLQ